MKENNNAKSKVGSWKSSLSHNVSKKLLIFIFFFSSSSSFLRIYFFSLAMIHLPPPVHHYLPTKTYPLLHIKSHKKPPNLEHHFLFNLLLQVRTVMIRSCMDLLIGLDLSGVNPTKVNIFTSFTFRALFCLHIFLIHLTHCIHFHFFNFSQFHFSL